jgi:TM2 domain-containing membrane protein YozV
MFYGLLLILGLAFLLVLKIAKGIIKLVLALILIGVLIAVFSSKDEIDTASPNTVIAPIDTTATATTTTAP